MLATGGPGTLASSMAGLVDPPAMAAVGGPGGVVSSAPGLVDVPVRAAVAGPGTVAVRVAGLDASGISTSAPVRMAPSLIAARDAIGAAES